MCSSYTICCALVVFEKPYICVCCPRRIHGILCLKGGEHGQALQTRRGQQASRALRRDRAAWWSCKQSPQCPNRPWRSPSSDPGGGTPLEARKLIQPPAPSASGFFHAPASMPIRLFSRCSHCRRRGGRRETQQNGVLFGVGRGSPAPEGGEDGGVQRAARKLEGIRAGFAAFRSGMFLALYFVHELR